MAKLETNATLLWLDMEMTGLEVETNVPIEVAAIVTNWQFEPLEEYHSVIFQSQERLDAMDEWNQTHHRASGLYDLIKSGRPCSEVDTALEDLCARYFKKDRPVLAGNSISQDRLFIRAYMPKLEKRLHYRMLDVSSWKVIFNGVYNRPFKKKDSHRALDDILESINELKHYMSFVNP